ncbi:MAG TPA: alpha/beta hydrolase [Haliangium sp.]|nr:alpha/beta hydrolase [Haliangium sp.]
MYREYDHEGVARAYDIPSSLPAAIVAAHLATYAEWSRRVRSCLPARLDVPYGERPAQKLDIFMARASGSAPAPILAYFHGGGWRHGSKDERAFPAEVFTAAGAIWIAVGYSLCPAVTIDEMIEEARAAMAWLHRHASTFGGDPRRIYVAGTSAGSHLAAMALGTQWQSRGLPADLVRGGFLLSGIFDFEPLTHHRFPDPAERFRDPARQSAPRSHRWLSPMSCLPRAGDVVVAVGENEPAEFRRQSIDYYDALRKRGLAAKLLLAPGQDHFSFIGEWGRPDSALVRSVCAELGLLWPA